MKVFIVGIVIISLSQAKVSGRVKNDPNFQMNDLVDWSSLPGRRDFEDDDDDNAEFKRNEEKRGDDSTFNINDLVDWTSIEEASTKNEEISNKDTEGEHLSPDDFRQADMVQDDGHFKTDPIEKAGLFEGDIDNVSLDDLKKSQEGRNAIRDSWRKWPDATIHYVISNTFNKRERGVIAKAMKEYHEKTCIRFKPRTSERAYIHIMKGNGCSSSIGRTGSKQSVSLGTGCVYAGIVMHELMHASGFWHEQSRADRDDYITINWNNILKGMEYNFLKYDLRKIDHLGATYDTCSVMHYGSTAFAKSYGKPTIVPKQAGKCKIGQRNGFSDTDVRKLNSLYQCTGYAQVGSGSSGSKPKPKPWVKPSCVDNNEYCATWASQKECRNNPSWMLVNCPVACEQCDVTCEDNSVHCADWASTKQCEKNPEYMDIYCAKSCRKCSASSDCLDENKSCSSWAGKGYCKGGKYVDYMKLRCKKSCKKC